MKVYIGSNFQPRHYVGSNYGEVIISSSFAYDTDAINFFSASGITDTGVKDSINTFVTSLKSDGLWTKMVQILPFVGDSGTNLTSSFSYNLKDTGSYIATYVGAFNGDLDGFQAIRRSDTDGDVLDTNLNPSNIWTDRLNGGHVAVYTNSPADEEDAWDWGVWDSSNRFSFMIVGRNLSGGNSSKVARLMSTENQVSITDATVSGCFVASQLWPTSTSSSLEYRQNGTLIGKVDSSAATFVRGQADAYLGANFRQAVNREDAPSNKKYQFLSVGYGLTTAEMNTLSTRIQTFQENIDTALGTSRAV